MTDHSLMDEPRNVACEWCGYEIVNDANVFFTESGRVLDAGCYATVFDEDFEKREAKRDR